MNEHAPQSVRSFDQPVAHLHPHEHSVFVYHDDAELRRGVQRFVDDGAPANALLVFVHAFPSEEEAWRILQDATGRPLRESGIVLVSLYRDAFEGGDRRIDFDHARRVVESLAERADAEGRTGLRIFVDASRVYFDEERDEEWFAFESWLGRRLEAAVGLVCAYRAQDAYHPARFADVLRTHAYRFDAARRMH